MKKILAAALILTLLLSASGCSLVNNMLNSSPDVSADTAAETPESASTPSNDTASPSPSEEADTGTASEAAASPSPDDAAASSGIMSAFTAVDLDGKSVDQSIFSGYKLTMVNVWATFCSPCISEMPELGVLNRNYVENGFQIIGIVGDASDGETVDAGTVDTAMEIIEQTGADYLHILPSADLMDGFLSEVIYVPTTIFVDENGNQVGEQYVGALSYEEWLDIVDDLLEEVG